jgi:hypothetical protein
MKNCSWRRFLLLTAIAFSVWGCRSETIRWVGHTDLEITFLVVDEATAQPIPRARIEVHSEGGLYEGVKHQDFALVADRAGRLKHLFKDSMCFGTTGPNIDTYVVHLPDWYYRASAPGFEPTEMTALDVLENRKRVRRGKQAATLEVEVPMRQRRAEPGAVARPRE